jgi:hypothetical protein
MKKRTVKPRIPKESRAHLKKGGVHRDKKKNYSRKEKHKLGRDN